MLTYNGEKHRVQSLISNMLENTQNAKKLDWKEMYINNNNDYFSVAGIWENVCMLVL